MNEEILQDINKYKSSQQFKDMNLQNINLQNPFSTINRVFGSGPDDPIIELNHEIKETPTTDPNQKYKYIYIGLFKHYKVAEFKYIYNPTSSSYIIKISYKKNVNGDIQTISYVIVIKYCDNFNDMVNKAIIKITKDYDKTLSSFDTLTTCTVFYIYQVIFYGMYLIWLHITINNGDENPILKLKLGTCFENFYNIHIEPTLITIFDEDTAHDYYTLNDYYMYISNCALVLLIDEDWCKERYNSDAGECWLSALRT